MSIQLQQVFRWLLVFLSILLVWTPVTAVASPAGTATAIHAPVSAISPELLSKWRAGAENGYGPDQYRLGLAYAAGDGVPQNFAEAARWWRRGAYNINPHAELMLGEAYAHGWGVPRNMNKAIHWWEAAARYGDAKVSSRARLLLNSAI